VLISMERHADMPLVVQEPDRFDEALQERLAQDEALKQYVELCRTSSQTFVDLGSGKPTRSGMQPAQQSRSSIGQPSLRSRSSAEAQVSGTRRS
jgi:hypothetical protein